MSEQLLERIKGCATLPSLPSIAVEVLELAQKADADIAEIARLISKDPALSTKMLRTVNSSFYGRSQAVSTISHALVILGLQSVKTLVLGFSLVSNLSKTKTTGFKHLTYWKRSIYSATAARVLSQRIGMVQQEEAFLCGLLQDIGMLVLDQVLGEPYGAIYEKSATHVELVEAERKELGMTHADIGGFLAGVWKLPPLLQIPIKQHHSPEAVTDASVKRLTEVVAVSGNCADVFIDPVAAPAIARVRELCQAQFKFSEADCDAMLDEVGKRTKEVATLFEINIGSGIQYEAILKKAGEALVEISLQTVQQAGQLQQQNQQLQQRVATDGLTGLATRSRLDEFLAQTFDIALAKGKPLSLVMIDLDKFKLINDTHGHPAGDAVLRYVSRLLKAAARKGDLVARYGGEEMVVVLPDTQREKAVTIAETVRRALASRPVPVPTGPIAVTASFGVACFEPGSPLRHPDHLIKAADMALYNAKNSGRNLVKAFAGKPVAQAA